MRLREVKMGGKRSIISLIIVCLIGCMLCGCDKKQDTEKEIGKNAPKIVVGSDNYPPFNYMDENGNPTGIDVDIAIQTIPPSPSDENFTINESKNLQRNLF